MSLKDAHRAEARGDRATAVALARANLAKHPHNPNAHRALAMFLKRGGDTDGYLEALHIWSKTKSLIGRFEALDRISRHTALHATLGAKVQKIVITARMKRLRQMIEAGHGKPVDRISLALYLGDLDRAKALIFDLEPDRRHATIQSVLSKVQADLRAADQGDVLYDMYRDHTDILDTRPMVALGMARDLVAADRRHDARALLPVLDRIDDLGIDTAELRHTIADTPDTAQAWRAALDADAQPRHLVRYVLATKDAQVARDLAARSDWGKITPAQACQMIDDQFARDDLKTAFTLCVAAIEVWPDNQSLLERANMLAHDAAQEELALVGRKRELLRREVGPDLIELIGSQPLEDAGGRPFLHNLIRDLVADTPDANGLMDMARLCLSSYQIMVADRVGAVREATALHAHGAANWEAQRPRAQRLYDLIRAVLATAARVDPDHPDLPRLLLDVQAVDVTTAIRTPDFSHALLRMVMAATTPDQNPQLDALLAKLALSCADADIHADFAAWQGDALTVMPFHTVEDTTLPPLPDTAPDQPRTKTIHITGPRFTGDVALAFDPDLPRLSAPRAATVHAGYLVSLDGTGVLDLTHGRSVQRAEPPVRFTGARAVALETGQKNSPPDYTCDLPVLIVPAGRVHFRNYFHFTGQFLPRLLTLVAYADANGPAPLIAIPDFAESFVVNMLELAGIDPARIFRMTDGTGHFTNAFVSGPVTDMTQCTADDLARIRSCLGNGTCATPDGPRYFLQRSITSVRNLGRSLTNAADLADVAQAAGYTPVDPGLMTQADQRDMFRGAAAICGPTGAALSNMLYLPDGAGVTCFSPHETCRTYFPGLTLGQNLDFTWVLGTFDPELVHSRRYPHRPFSVNPEDLERALSQRQARTEQI